jgi:hypothetical protein
MRILWRGLGAAQRDQWHVRRQPSLPVARDQARTSETDLPESRHRHCGRFPETDGYSRNVRIFENLSDGSLSGLSLAQALDGPTWVVRNVIVNWGVCAATRIDDNWGYPIKTNGGDGYLDLGTGPVLFYHNWSYTQDPESRAFLVKVAMWRQFRFRNIWCGDGPYDFEPRIRLTDWDYDDIYHGVGLFANLGGLGARQTLEEPRGWSSADFGEPGWRAPISGSTPRTRTAATTDCGILPGCGRRDPRINDLRPRYGADMGRSKASRDPPRRREHTEGILRLCGGRPDVCSGTEEAVPRRFGGWEGVRGGGGEVMCTCCDRHR